MKVKLLIALLLSCCLSFGQQALFHADNVTISAPPGSGYDADAQRFLDSVALTDVLTTTEKNAVNQLVLDYKSAGLWTGEKAIYPIIGSTANSHKWNLKDPSKFKLTYSGGPLHSSSGMTFTGSEQANTGLIPSTELSVNNSHIAYYSGSNNPSGGTAGVGVSMGSSDAATTFYTYLVVNYAGTNYFTNSNTDNRTSSFSAGDGLFDNSRTSSADFSIYHNGTAISTTAGGSTTSISSGPNRSITIGNVNYGNHSLFGAGLCQGAAIGAGISSGNATAYYTVWHTYETSIGR